MKLINVRDDRNIENPWWARDEEQRSTREDEHEQENYVDFREKSVCRSFMDKVWGLVSPPFILLLVWLAFSAWNFIAASALSTGINALALSLERELLALPFMLSFALYQDGRVMLISRYHIPHLLLVALCSALNIVCATFALDYLPSGVVSCSELSVGIMTVLFCWLFRVERGSKLKLFAVAIATAGAIMVQYRYDKDGGFNSDDGKANSAFWWVGALLICAQVIAAAGLATSLPSLVMEYSPWSVTFWYSLIATLLTGCMCFFTHTSIKDFWLGGKVEPWFALLYGTLVVSTFNWMALSWVFSKVKPSSVMATITTQPVSTYFLALLVHGHPKLTAVPISGMIIVIGGLLMVVFAQKREQDLDEEEHYDSLQGGGETKPLLAGCEDTEGGGGRRGGGGGGGYVSDFERQQQHIGRYQFHHDEESWVNTTGGDGGGGGKSGTVKDSKVRARSKVPSYDSHSKYNSQHASTDGGRRTWDLIDDEEQTTGQSAAGGSIDGDRGGGTRGGRGGGGGGGKAEGTGSTSSTSSWWEMGDSSKGGSKDLTLQ